ncbi:MAG: glycerophosphoryl diester phosphodiesterase [Pseudohongiellaceae bacterium]|jgi:glycerophosphoryl diester phosphodiesterase
MTSKLSLKQFKQRIIAHRGWQHQFPENSYAGIKAALELGIRHIEIDAHLTADHIPVVCHDHHLIRLCEQDSDVRHLTLAELQALSFHEPSRLGSKHFPTQLITLQRCTELIAQYPNATLYVEIKRKSLYYFEHNTVLTAIHHNLQSIQAQACLMSFDIEILQLAQQQSLPYPLIPVLLNKQQLHSEEISSLNPAMVFSNIKHLSHTDEIKQLPWPIVFYEIDDIQQALSLIAAGAKGIETFSCGELLAGFESH